MIALSGVRSSWDMFARNCDLCWLASASWLFASWSSSNSRAFSMAMTAWSANVSSSAISLLGERARLRTRDRRSRRSASPSRSSGTASWCAWPTSLTARCSRILGSARRCGRSSGCGSVRRSRIARPADPSPTASRQRHRESSSRLIGPCRAATTQLVAFDATRCTALRRARRAATALSTMASSTGCRSVGEDGDDAQDLGQWPSAAPAPRSARALRCSSSSNSRAFSMAMTAWSANVSSSAICCSVNGATSSRPIDDARRSALPSRSSGTSRPSCAGRREPHAPVGILAWTPARRDRHGIAIVTAVQRWHCR